jgi:hypothetical protein
MLNKQFFIGDEKTGHLVTMSWAISHFSDRNLKTELVIKVCFGAKSGFQVNRIRIKIVALSTWFLLFKW